jgi:thioredoxin reductase (NADPH)
MEEAPWDLIIIGAGPAGLTAGIYGARSGLNTLVLEKGMPGGGLNETPLVENYPGFPNGIRGQDLASKMMEQCENAGAEIHFMDNVTDIEFKGKKKLVTTDKALYSCDSMIIATGTKHRRLGIPSEERYRGRGISYCAVCDGPLFKDEKVIVVGGGNSAAIDALHLSNLTSSVKLIHRRDSLRAERALIDDMKRNGVEILFNTEVKEFRGDERVRSVILHHNKTGDLTEMEVGGAFIAIGMIPNTEIVRKLGVKLDNGYILVDQRQMTNIEGIYAAGDVTMCPHRQIGKAIGDAIVAATEAYGYIKRPYYYKY